MSYRRAVIMVAVLLGLGACAEYPTNYRSDVYEDGSYYRPADAGRGDYYYAPEPDYRDYDFYDGGFGFGPPFYSSFGGFCSPRFIYCSPFGYGPFGDPFHRFGGYDPFWNGYYGYPSPYRGRRPHRRDDSGPDIGRGAMPPMRSMPPRERVFQTAPPRELRRAEPVESEDRGRRRARAREDDPS